MFIIFQQTGLVQLSSSVNSCSTSDNQTSSQTNMTIDMNTVSSGHICLHHISVSHQYITVLYCARNTVMTGYSWLVLHVFSDGINVSVSMIHPAMTKYSDSMILCTFCCDMKLFYGAFIVESSIDH